MNIGMSGMRMKAYLIIISAFVIGVVTGGLLLNLLAGRSLANKRPPTPLEEMTNILELDAPQRQQIEKIFEASRQHSKEIIKAVQPQLDDLKKQTRGQVTAVLRPAQQEKYVEWNKKRDAQREKQEKH
ncbi:MAG: hypothetical protein U0Y68_00120 [Blastocatellia bacterium]